jgi:hypothetical protein
MPTIELTRQRQYECHFADCDERRTPHSSVAGSFCSPECAARHEGRQFLRAVRYDHRFCRSCWRQRKEIERPTDEARRGKGRFTAEAMIGFEHPTRHVNRGPYGLECECGAVDHDTPDFDRRDDGPYHWFLYLVSQQLVAEGQREDAIDLRTFADTYWRTDDLELAVGKALRR